MGNIVHQMMGGLRSSMGYTGSSELKIFAKMQNL